MKKTTRYTKLILLLLLCSTSLMQRASAQYTVYYAMTAEGGSHNQGAIIMFDSIWNGPLQMEQVLYSFGSSDSDGGLPLGNLTFDPANGLFYGMTQYGGNKDSGAIISFDPATNAEQVVWSFQGGADGRGPKGSLVYDSASNVLGGMTPYGGRYQGGTLFVFDPGINRDTVVWSFGTQGDGAYPQANLTYDPLTGLYYATTQRGGVSDSGTVISFNPATGAERVAYSFTGDGALPMGNLTYNPNTGLYYGTTNIGGAYDGGTIFSFNTTTDTMQVAWSFGQSFDGIYPTADLSYYAPTGAMFGMTPQGGFDSIQLGIIYIFIASDNAERVVWSFGSDQFDGSYPNGNLTYNPTDGLYYGMTTSRGAVATGTIFDFEPVHHIEHAQWELGSGADGAAPYGSLVPYALVPTGIAAVAAPQAIGLYPNPANGIINVSGLTTGQTIAIYDYLGEKVNHLNDETSTVQIDLSAQQNGVYLVQILNKDGSVAGERKVVKE
jgi:uncharacterized repeat protein (TIGR03803 family)